MNALAGIDIGGSGARVGIVSLEGELRGTVSSRFPGHAPSGSEFLADLIEQARSEVGNVALSAIGIGASGPVDPGRGTIENPHTLPLWLQGDVVGPLSRNVGVQVVIENDANAAALGEYWRGAGRGANRLLCVTVGTGIGVAFLRSGEVDRSEIGAHGEAGHHLLDPAGPQCYCGARGCWESLCSGAAIARDAKKRGFEGHPRLHDSVSSEPSGADAVVVAARSGNTEARSTIDVAATYLGRGLVNAIAYLTPDLIILGGRVMASYDLFRGRVEEVLKAHAMMVPCKSVEVVPAQLGSSAGMVGAAYAALQALNGTELADRLLPGASEQG